MKKTTLTIAGLLLSFSVAPAFSEDAISTTTTPSASTTTPTTTTPDASSAVGSTRDCQSEFDACKRATPGTMPSTTAPSTTTPLTTPSTTTPSTDSNTTTDTY